MKTSVIAASAIVALLALGATTVVFANSGFMTHGLGAGHNDSQSTNSGSSTTTTTQSGEHENDNETGDQNNQGQNNQGEDNQTEAAHFNLTVGQSLTFANLTGHWVAFSHMGNDSRDSEDSFTTQSGNSTGAFTFKVTSVSGGDFNATITSGKFTINGTTYTVSGGSLMSSGDGEGGFGNGTASGGATFEIHVGGIHGNLTSSALVGAIRLDVKIGTSEYLVILGSQEGVGENATED